MLDKEESSLAAYWLNPAPFDTPGVRRIFRFRNSFGAVAVPTSLGTHAPWVTWLVRFHGRDLADFCPCNVADIPSLLGPVNDEELAAYVARIRGLAHVRALLPDEVDIPF